MDSDLEAFSRIPAGGMFAVLASQLSTSPSIWTKCSFRTDFDRSCIIKLISMGKTNLSHDGLNPAHGPLLVGEQSNTLRHLRLNDGESRHRRINKQTRYGFLCFSCLRPVRSTPKGLGRQGHLPTISPHLETLWFLQEGS